MGFFPGLLAFVLAWPATAEAAATKPNDCQHTVGVWEYRPPSWPGRAIIASHGDKCIGVWFSRDPKVPASRPTSDAEKAALLAGTRGGAWEYDCEGVPEKLRCKVRVIHAVDPSAAGTEWLQDVETHGDDATLWSVSPDGKRSDKPTGAARRLK
jgi:hypothetical protein